VFVESTGWCSDRFRDTDETVRWRPVIEVTGAGVWAGQTENESWVVGRPGHHVLPVDSLPGAIALLPLLERPMVEVAAYLAVGSLAEHPLGFERVVAAALDKRSSGYWAAHAIAWLDAGFPAARYQDALRRVVTDKRVSQRARQAAWRILSSASLPARRAEGGTANSPG
jgi:hypothetical protein